VSMDIERESDQSTSWQGTEVVRLSSRSSDGETAMPDRLPRPAKNQGVYEYPIRLDGGLQPGRLSPADRIAFYYLAFTGILILIFHRQIDGWLELTAAHALAIAGIFALSRLKVANPTRLTGGEPHGPATLVAFARSWYPLILIPLTYKELSYLIPLIHPHDFDRELALIDRRMLGVDPLIWLDRINYPAIALVLQLSYLTFYFIPIALGIVLWRERRFSDYQFFMFVVLLGFFVSFIGYLAVPAIGPRFFLSPEVVRPFDGPAIASIRAVLDRLEGVTRDCFPSGHTEITLLALFYAHRFHKRTFLVLLPVGSALILSTVYLRYHYVIDVIAGVATALAVILAAGWLYKATGGFRARCLDRSGGSTSGVAIQGQVKKDDQDDRRSRNAGPG